MNKAALLDLLRSHAFGGQAGNRDCLDEIRCSGFVDGKLTESEREAVIDHLTNCRNCTDLVAGVVQMQREDVAAIPGDLLAAALELKPRRQPRRISSKYHWRTQLAAAASVLLLIGALVWQFEEIPSPERANDSLRPISGDQADVRTGAHDQERFNIIFPTGDTTVDPDNLNLQWSPIDRSVFYQVQLLSDDGDVVWEGRTEDTDIQIPQGIQFDPAGGYFLWVKAHMSDGKTIKSKAVFIRIKDDGQQ